jgi:hypothetical protein
VIRGFTLLGWILAGVIACAGEPDSTGTKKEPAAPAKLDVAKTAEQIIKDAEAAGKRLADKDAGNATQQLQKDVLKNIDELLKKAKEPPPMNNDSQPQGNGSGMGGMGSPKKAPGGTTSGVPQSRQERREKNRAAASGGQPLPGASQASRSDPKVGPGSPVGRPNQIEPKGMLSRVPDVYKNVWGDLPEKMRQEMDLYFREQFMPNYSELLRQYYSSLAERSGKAKSNP